jgi:outer membrane protein assembly factor BamD (BamD/ComL family)
VKRLFFLLVMTALPACAGMMVGHDDALERADRLFQEKKYSDAVAVYDEVARQNPGSKQGARALYSAAAALSFYDNPHKDYAEALQDFDTFLLMYPDDEKAPDAQNWRYVLKTVLELRKENGKLLQSIDELKQIDIRHEERRKTR